MNLCRKCIHWNDCNNVGIKVGINVIAFLACEKYDEGYKDENVGSNFTS